MVRDKDIPKVAANVALACTTALAALHKIPYPLTNCTTATERFAMQEMLNILNTTAKALQRTADGSIRTSERQ